MHLQPRRDDIARKLSGRRFALSLSVIPHPVARLL
jgi:hypothetical protein